ncbi:hypothetical protein G647_05921 [Cladophialophora carrionii CBS 160.54]|uniref:Uncharacterized protein n=1 Tax=Cladophialophora carrionii CBS 160.54 TaxID=1279043 RepID=V9D7A5_9EURO|nr:uncharacterized protein G647_05921 [Cladophialophora carrionii CBS 160.54]ETI21852.1 hypothetical protein G647_05921 [Cladophialophora carrionii CBS 160.54]
MAREFTIVLVPSPRQSARERELQASTVRSHAARVSSAQAAVTKWSKRTAVLNTRADHRARVKQQLGAKEAASTILATTLPGPDDESSITITLPSPIMILGQGQVDPFTNDDLHTLPPIARNSLEYMMETIWGKNSPGLSRATLTNHITHCKMLAVHSPLQFHTQISSAVTLCYALSKDPEVLKTLLATRLKHQTAALSILRDSIANLTGPPSDELIDCLSRLAAQGGDLAKPGSVSRYRESPIADSFPIRLYGCFEPCIPHFQALSFLIRQRGSLEVIAPAISHHLSLADTMLATKLGTRPTFPVHRDLRQASDKRQLPFDGEAAELCFNMGSGWKMLAESHPEIVKLALRAGEITSALDQSCRGGQGCLPFPQLVILAIAFQHDLYSLESPADHSSSPEDACCWTSEICRFALQIYSDVVLFPAPESSGVRQRLAAQLWGPLAAYNAARDPDTDTCYRELILWATVMGAVSAEATKHRDWYLRQLVKMVIDQNISWEIFKRSLARFLWWEYTLGEHVRDIWKDAWGLAHADGFTNTPSA